MITGHGFSGTLVRSRLDHSVITLRQQILIVGRESLTLDPGPESGSQEHPSLVLRLILLWAYVSCVCFVSMSACVCMNRCVLEGWGEEATVFILLNCFPVPFSGICPSAFHGAERPGDLIS